MICIKCLDENTKCIDDMLQVGYVAEIYKCNSCKGIIEVEYKDQNISHKNIKIYKYISA